MNNTPNKKDSIDMRVTKRDGCLEEIAFDKILNRIKKLGAEVDIHINYQQLVIKVIDQLYDTISTTKIDELAAEQCASMSTLHPDYATLASRILVSNHQKNTEPAFSDVMKNLFNFRDIHNNLYPLISDNLWNFTRKHKEEIDQMIDHNRDYLIDYFGFKTLERAYLFKLNGKIVERPQHMWMRVSIGIHCSQANSNNLLALVKETYDLMSQKFFTHATPTLFNAGTPRQQLSSCYLIAMEDDSLDGIYNTLKDCALISKYAGGVGLHIHNIRAKGTHIQGTNGTSNGLVPMLRVYNNTARYVDQGGGKRNGSFAIYLEPWHADIFDFLEMRKNHGDEETKARDLFYAVWVPDLFMERVKEKDGTWSLMCPRECPGLSDVYGDEFKQLYEKYERAGKARKTILARELWFAILDAQMETGTPYILYKDAVNKKSNQKNLGTIKSSNLCTEVTQYSDDKETAVCNLASIALPAFVNTNDKSFDYDRLHEVVKVVTNNLNKVIDINFYPTEKTKVSNMRHRPIGLGVQGLADAFILMDIPFHSEEAKKVNKLIFETIYHGALEKSNEISKERGEFLASLKNESRFNLLDQVSEYEHASGILKRTDERLLGAYSSFEGSPSSQGILQFDMWSVEPTPNRYDWDQLKQNIITYGLRNSLLVAPMPTASTSQILGYNECFEPLTSNLYTRRTLAGEFVVVNKYLMKELIEMGEWNEQIKNNIIANKGSIQQLTQLSQHIRDKYKIVWEMPMKHLIDMSADRGAFICQSQSLNLWMEDPVYNKLTSMHFYSWEKGLKTGIYYLRRKAKHQAQQFTIEPEKQKHDKKQVVLKEDEGCEMCSA
uniref:ribonucleoside-diphosphate reductase n=1 Tax=viral metagenome TaxID=1070528 RepID=A0A6C0ITF4_9ZZZZ